MNRHTYYKLLFTLTSPLNISSGENLNTDRDILLNSQGDPFLPATGIAGSLRSLAATASFPGGTEEKLFGTTNGGKADQSQVYVYDADLVQDSGWKLNHRDNVALDEYRTGIDKRKFDSECVEPGAAFVGYLEVDKNASDDVCPTLEKLLGMLAAQECLFGSKVNRGLGRAKLSVWKTEFDLSSATDRQAWLDFDLFSPSAFSGEPIVLPQVKSSSYLSVTLDLILKGALSIRVYKTEPNTDKNSPEADYTTLRSGGFPAVPGTSWAGAFRHRFAELCPDSNMQDELFGHVKDATHDTSKASCITFSETVLRGSTPVILTRNAIDRFTAKTKDGALYTEETVYGGTGSLRIDISKKADPKSVGILGAIFADLVHGYLPVGGLSSVGRGQFEVSRITVDGQEHSLSMPDWENELIAVLKGGLVK